MNSLEMVEIILIDNIRPFQNHPFEVRVDDAMKNGYEYPLEKLNDCKCGCEVNGQRMIITLLKAPMNPNPKSDRGDRYFTYSLYPHAGNWKDAKTLVRGLELNNPMLPVELAEDAKGAECGSFIAVDGKTMSFEIKCYKVKTK